MKMRGVTYCIVTPLPSEDPDDGTYCCWKCVLWNILRFSAGRCNSL